MSCGCSSTTTPSSSTSCGGCGYQCTSCICPADPIVMPTVTCPDPVACDEIFPLECIEYSGDDIKCSTTATTLYPNVTHTVATKGDTMTNVLNNINSQLCYLFSADYISRMLTNIKEDNALSSLFCSIVCGSAPTSLICPTVASVTYNYNSTTLQYYLAAQINYVPFATSYAYRFYAETTTGIFDTALFGGTILQPPTTTPITLIGAIPSPSTNTPSKNYAVLVQAIDSITPFLNPSGVAPINVPSSTFNYSTVATDNPYNCGINKYTGSTAELTCILANLNGSFKPAAANTSALQFLFTTEISNPLYVPVVNYTVHWYLKVSSPTISYVYQGNSGAITYASSQAQTINLYKPSITITSGGLSKASSTLTVTSVAHGLVSGMNIQIDTPITGVPSSAYTITVTSVDAFYFTVGNTTALAGSQSLTYKSQMNPLTDKVVAMIYTNATDTCNKGIPYISGTVYNDAQITGYLSNPNNNVFKNY
jgi:hypothetical protein